jgi:upstream activation factor subunit UAF30
LITVTTEELERYTAIIDNILETSDLETISRKKIRQGLEDALGGQDLSEQKVCTRTGFVVPESHDILCFLVIHSL